MRIAYAVFAFSLVVFGFAGFALGACDEDSIETISSEGDLIVLVSGAAYDVAAGDEITSSLWQEGDNALVCGDTIVDKDQNGEHVDVTPH
jgi:hypothetical protein